MLADSVQARYKLTTAPTGENRDVNVEEEIRDFYSDYPGLRARYDLISKIGEGLFITLKSNPYIQGRLPLYTRQLTSTTIIMRIRLGILKLLAS